MRHRVYGKHLSRDKNERTALFRSLVRSLILSEKIQTTEAKAKAIKGLVDKLVNQAKSTNTQRLLAQFLVDKEAREKLVKDLAPRLGDRNSGYTSIIRLGRRQGDGAMEVQMSFLAAPIKEETKSAAKKEASKKEDNKEKEEKKDK